MYTYIRISKKLSNVFLLSMCLLHLVYTLYMFQELACIYVEVRASVLISNSVA